MIRKLSIRSTARWKCDAVLAVSTICAVLPKYAGRSDDTGNEQVGLDILTLDPRLECQPLLEQSDGIVGLEFLPEPDAGID